jgi:hypothetical protein
VRKHSDLLSAIYLNLLNKSGIFYIKYLTINQQFTKLPQLNLFLPFVYSSSQIESSGSWTNAEDFFLSLYYVLIIIKKSITMREEKDFQYPQPQLFSWTEIKASRNRIKQVGQQEAKIRVQ